LSIKPEIDDAIQHVLDRSAFAAGPFVKSFEEHFAAAHQAKYCVGVYSGTAALHIVFMALEIGPGDEVIVPANTFFATPEAVSLAGCFSLYPGKNHGAYGEGGAVITNDEALYKKMMLLRDHGSAQKYHRDLIGHNYRLEGMQGAILDVKLK
jgi:dTDP-4-amino-4,6-dideoxygalactose transaminase